MSRDGDRTPAPSLQLARPWRLERSDGAEDRIAHRSTCRAVERDGHPQLGRQAANALAAASRRQHQPRELSPDLIGLAVGEHEGNTPGRLERSVGSGPCEQQAFGASALGRRQAAHQERLGAAVLVLYPGATPHSGQVFAAESFGDDAL
jgi:hypothetical protein